jgi:magnesium-transporting ATPase (P-type)
MVPADCFFIEGFNLELDESNLTGETKGNFKTAKSPFLFAGSQVLDGLATVLVTAVGVNTEWGSACMYMHTN